MEISEKPAIRIEDMDLEFESTGTNMPRVTKFQ